MLKSQKIEANFSQEIELAHTESTELANIYKIHNKDARKLDEIIQGELIDVTVTSPPYFDLKDYGHKDQIGYGQKYDKYLEDLTVVFSKVYSVTKDTGSLWVVIDSFKRDGQIVPLPFDFAAALKTVGWKFQDIIIWHKDRTVPWSNGGITRNIFEYVLLFSKTENYKYLSDRVRDYQDLKKWWVKYPERYNPKGKNLDEVWNFGIPTQGSWGSGYIKHFCPLPEGLVDRIINLTTDKGDVVLDPFSGSGMVPAQACFRNRKYIGFELNSSYIDMFETYLKENLEQKRSQFNSEVLRKRESTEFEELIIDLRVLKFARVLKRALKKNIKDSYTIFVSRSDDLPTEKHKIVTARYSFIFYGQETLEDVIKIEIDHLIKTPPLSKFGIEAQIEIITDPKAFISSLSETAFFTYSEQCTHKYKSEIQKDLITADFSILSPIKVDLNEKDYE